MFPDNIFQAAFQQVSIYILVVIDFSVNYLIIYSAISSLTNDFSPLLFQAHTVYVPKKPLLQNHSEDEGDVEVIGQEELMRVIQYRSGTNTLGIVFFCLVFGTFLGTLAEKGQVVIDFFKAVFEVIMRMVSAVMW